MSMVLLDRPFDVSTLSATDQLDLRNVSFKAWPAVLSACRTEDLRLYHILLPSLEGIERLTSVRRLAVEWATKVTDLGPLFKLTGLTNLRLFDLPKVRSLEGVEELENLSELWLSGDRTSLTSPMRLASLEPVTRIPGLVSFSLENARLDDDDITVLARCKNLRKLGLSNQFDRAQYAFLFKRLGPQLEAPITAYRGSSGKCKTCGQDKSMFTGRRMPILCRTCDADRFERHVAEFERLVRDA